MTSTLSEQIQQFYDASSGLWEQVWGEHMHHGYYGADGKTQKERRQAQIDLIEELLKWAGITKAEKILDVGCGIGGSSLYLAEKFGAEATGITLSPVQANRAKERSRVAQISANFQVADALNMPFEDNSFDLVWSLESGEHMPDKQKFLAECYRVLKPGGTFIMATWCHRPTDQVPLTIDDRKRLAEIYRVYCLPYVISLPEYTAIAQEIGLQDIQTADWSTAVAPFWNVVIDSAFTPGAIFGLLTSGWTTIQAALSLGSMQQGYKRGLIKFGLLCGKKV
ncbi:type 11 methyltransferase [Leptolyngbya boryana NIES-2135]|jgi:tocopherol O-methyltransferase|uniref:Type 11 methyltransferase n=1 Tax=Leptolyngbya boryana NIES-2135 TaxID=1973484 RepID=A0A1Z4JFH3_LEPBY|nr:MULTISPECIES: methyltransferase domain-containing protein [Leptolyngbya]BAY55525.1 type 11 methyltransferase [Leptolyngbya boryana NIES-2135]MBD2368324.1 methyltransferase domain-containing protein [Leptolyngbya sp. FACHB-161]MBD2375020.1 methyltransferase domain-containing protein [Leptolyngbya sp. FACHB-238]MBD2399440.1 methyltransferase domain-containing protein [Leptolyngbya sp. FACHB-239]MBD2405645.1 methyltransferase domain-containing protein [Leptolyngbya sp. FACHB-402]